VIFPPQGYALIKIWSEATYFWGQGDSPCKRFVYTQTLLADIIGTLLSPYGERYIRLLSYKGNNDLHLTFALKANHHLLIGQCA